MRSIVKAMLVVGALMVASSLAAQTTSTTPPVVNNTVANQTAVPTTTVADASRVEEDRAREALLPIGARFGSFTLYPKLESQLTYNDNIYALQNKTGDGIARISPTAELRGDFGTATGAARLSLDRYQYVSNTTENRTDWSVGGNLQDEITRDVFVYGAGGYSQAHEDRGDPNSLATQRTPTRYRLTEAGLGFSSDLSRVSYGLDGSFRRYRFYDNQQIGGAVIDNQGRSRDLYRAAGRLGYEFSPGYRLLARGSYEDVRYDRVLDAAGFDRRSHGVRGTLGVEFELTRLLTGEVFGGYLRRDFDDGRFRPVAAGVYGAKLTWRPTALTTVRIDVDRSVQETIAANFSSYLSTAASLAVEHELLRTVILSASARYGDDDYQVSRVVAGTRTDKNYGATAGVRYILNRTVYAGLSYDWTKRTSNAVGPGLQYDRNRVSATLGLQF